MRIDGRLDEPAWQQATRFPVGPLFDDWAAGPFWLDVRACRDAARVYLGIRAPRDLTDLRALSTAGELLTANDHSYHVGPDGGVPAESLGRDGETSVLELAIPATGPVSLAFPVELLRRTAGRLPPAASALGLASLGEPAERRSHYRSPTLWLQPFTVRLLPARSAARIAWSNDNGKLALAWELSESKTPAKSGRLELELPPEQSVYAIPATPLGEPRFTWEGFFYAESPAAELRADAADRRPAPCEFVRVRGSGGAGMHGPGTRTGRTACRRTPGDRRPTGRPGRVAAAVLPGPATSQPGPPEPAGRAAAVRQTASLFRRTHLRRLLPLASGRRDLFA